MFLKSGNAGSTILDGNVVFNNTGTLDVLEGNVALHGSYSLTNGIVSFWINSLTNYGTISIPGAAALTGTISANYNDGFIPDIGDQFQVVTSSGVNGVFSSVNVPAGVQVIYADNGVILDVTGLVPVQIVDTRLAGGNLLFQFQTISGESYTIQTNDDLSTTNWGFYTNIIGSGTVFQFQTPVLATPARNFYRILEP
jgi:hypothetical protein